MKSLRERAVDQQRELLAVGRHGHSRHRDACRRSRRDHPHRAGMAQLQGQGARPHHHRRSARRTIVTIIEVLIPSKHDDPEGSAACAPARIRRCARRAETGKGGDHLVVDRPLERDDEVGQPASPPAPASNSGRWRPPPGRRMSISSSPPLKRNADARLRPAAAPGPPRDRRRQIMRNTIRALPPGTPLSARWFPRRASRSAAAYGSSPGSTPPCGICQA